MGVLNNNFNKIIFDEIVSGINSNTSHYYAFGSNPVPYGNTIPNVGNNDYEKYFENNWNLLFGKKINASDISLVIKKNIWTQNTIYDRYDNTKDIHTKNNFYVICEPNVVGGSYYIYKCLDNANGAPSTISPASIDNPTRLDSFTTVQDGYRWKYITSISTKNFEKFSSDSYAPVVTDTTVASSAKEYAGVELVVITDPGIGYSAYNNGNVVSVQNSTVLQIENNASEFNDHYVNNAIYIYNNIDSTAQLREVSSYVVNSSGRWIFTDTAVNTEIITPSLTKYSISPKVVFDTDGDNTPLAYSTINTTANSIKSIVMLDIGSNITRANVRIQSNSSYGSGANMYAIVAPPGGHGSDAPVELNAKGICFNFSFSNNEANTIVTSNVVYNKIGLLKDPFILDTDSGNITKGGRFSNNTFDQVFKANVTYTFTVGDIVTSNTTNSKGRVIFANSTIVYIAGDKGFIDGEYVYNSSGLGSIIAINHYGDIYQKDLKPFYIDNINNINRSNTQTETFKLTIVT